MNMNCAQSVIDSELPDDCDYCDKCECEIKGDLIMINKKLQLCELCAEDYQDEEE